MINLSVEKMYGSTIAIHPMSIKREWMANTAQGHAYRCFPVSQANTVGWSLSCIEDIHFIWNGINDTTSENVKILNEKPYLYTGRGQSTICFNTGLVFRSDKDISLLTINPVNFFDPNFETMSSLISTSFYSNQNRVNRVRTCITGIPAYKEPDNGQSNEQCNHIEPARQIIT